METLCSSIRPSMKYHDLVKEDLKVLCNQFNLSENEISIANKFAEDIDYQDGRPRNIALAIIRILRSDMPRQEFYKLGETDYHILKKWVAICREKLKLKKEYF